MFSSWGSFAFQGTPVKSGVISVCEEGAGCRHPIKSPTVHGTDPTRKTYPAPNVSSNEVEKLCSSPTESYGDMNFIVTVVFLGKSGVRMVPGGGMSRPEPLMICVC